MSDKTWDIRFNGESGDEYHLGSFLNPFEPTKLQLDALARRDLEHKIEDGLLYGYFTVTEIIGVQNMPAEDPDATPLERL